jgi:hypothetical protein
VSIIGEQLDFGDSAVVFFKVANELTAAELPDTNVALHTAGAKEFAVAGKANGGHSTLVCVVDLPQHLAVVNAESANLSIRPAGKNNLIGKNGADREQVSALVAGGNTAGGHWVVVTVPKANGAILRTGDEFVTNSRHKPAAGHRGCVVLAKKHLGEIVAANSVDKATITGSQKLHAIRAGRKTVNWAIKLGLEERSDILGLSLEHNDLAITASNDYFITWDSSDCLDTKSASINGEGKDFALDKESNKVSTCGSGIQEIFVVFAVGHASVLTDHRSRVDCFGGSLASLRVQMPHSHLFGASNCELVVGRSPLLVVLGVTTPGHAKRCLGKDGGNNGEAANDMTIGSVPHEHLSVQCVSTAHQEAIVLTEGQKRYFVVVLWKSVNGSFFLEIPNDNVGILSALATGEQVTRVRDG